MIASLNWLDVERAAGGRMAVESSWQGAQERKT